MYCFISSLSDSTVQEDARIESRAVAISALAVRRSNYSALSHPLVLIELLCSVWLHEYRVHAAPAHRLHLPRQQGQLRDSQPVRPGDRIPDKVRTTNGFFRLTFQCVSVVYCIFNYKKALLNNKYTQVLVGFRFLIGTDFDFKNRLVLQNIFDNGSYPDPQLKANRISCLCRPLKAILEPSNQPYLCLLLRPGFCGWFSAVFACFFCRTNCLAWQIKL